MSQRQKEILTFITKHIREKGYSPTHREIALAVGLLSSSTVHGHIERLEKKGLITTSPSSPRTIKLVDEQSSEVQILKNNKGIPSVIEWQNRRYVYDPTMR
jgi:repressor LexA